jgi:hypothetical protein
MRPIARVLGAVAVIGIAAAGSAEPGKDRIQLAQAQESGGQPGAAKGANESRGAANRDSGGATTRGSQGGGSAAGAAASGDRATVKQETQDTNRTSVRTRSEGARVSVRGGSRTAVGVRTVARDDAVIIKRKKARRYVYSEPSTTVIRKKKRYVHYSEPSRTVVIKKRRPGVAIDTGVSTRTTVRSRTSTVSGSSGTREMIKSGASVRERSGGQGNAGTGGAASSTTGGGAASSTEGRTQGGGRSGNGSSGRSGPSGSSETPAAR